MGSYDSTCSLSDLQIGYGSQAHFIILVPNRLFFDETRSNAKKNFCIKVSPRSSYTYYDDLYVPFSLAIKGDYDTYGSLENVKEDEQTKYLEKYFDDSIENILKAITRNPYEDIFSSHHALFSKYTIPKIKNKLTSFGYILKDKDLKELGFIKLKNGRYGKKDLSFEISLDKKENKYYSLYREDKEIFSSRKNEIEDFFKNVQKETNVYLSVKREYRKKIATLSGLSGMMILSDVYEKFTKNLREYNLHDKVHKEFLINSGFITKVDKYGKEKFYCPDHDYITIEFSYNKNIYMSSDKDAYLYEEISSVKRLSERWEDLTGQVFDVSAYKNKETVFAKKFKSYIKSYNESNKLLEKLRKENKNIPFDLISKATRFLDETNRDSLLPKFRDNYAFINFLKPILEKGHMARELEDLKEICYIFSDNNKMLTQRHSGAQHADYRLSKKFYEDILSVIDEKIKQSDEDR